MLESGQSYAFLPRFLFNHVISSWYLGTSDGGSGIYIMETGKCYNSGHFLFVSLSWFTISQAYRRRGRVLETCE